MTHDQNIWFSVITPNGLIIRLDFDVTPKVIRDMFRDVENPSRINEEKAVASLSQMTGCRCTLHRTSQLSCEPNYKLNKD